ncbi:hypothetical protein [Glaciecola sp. SC05]|uniref:hypothetical protein n=1 Tax=Glaciecola sp. SC05 TaxID=1987355 RepID=UPI00352978D8
MAFATGLSKVTLTKIKQSLFDAFIYKEAWVENNRVDKQQAMHIFTASEHSGGGGSIHVVVMALLTGKA